MSLPIPSVLQNLVTEHSSPTHYSMIVASTQGKAMATMIQTILERGSKRMSGIGTHTAIIGPYGE